MKILNYILKIIGQILFVIIFLSTSTAKSLDKFNNADQVSNYFSGILLLNNSEYENSQRYLKKLNGLETSHLNYSAKYLYSLINSGNYKEAFNYSKKLEKLKLDSFESQLILGVYYLKNENISLAKKYFSKAKNRNSGLILNNYVSNSLYNWSNLINLNQATSELQKLNNRFENLNIIQNVFLNCHFNDSKTNNLFIEMISNQKTDFSRYNYFYASYVASAGNLKDSKRIVSNALENHPRNLLLNQYKIDLSKNKNVLAFSCKKEEHIIAEILYITANALSSQSIYPFQIFI